MPSTCRTGKKKFAKKLKGIIDAQLELRALPAVAVADAEARLVEPFILRFGVVGARVLGLVGKIEAGLQEAEVDAEARAYAHGQVLGQAAQFKFSIRKIVIPAAEPYVADVDKNSTF